MLSNSRDMCSLKNSIFPFIRRNGLILGTILGVILGSILGIGLRPLNISQPWIDIISFPGELFTRALQLIVLPFIICSMIYGSARMNAGVNGKIALRALIIFFLTSLINAIFGVIIVLILQPGNFGTEPREVQGQVALDEGRQNTILDNILDIGRNMIPPNIFESLFRQTHTIYEPINLDSGEISYIKRIATKDATNSLGIIVASLTFGTILSTMGEASKPLISVFGVIDGAVMRIIYGFIKLSPFGLASIVASKVLTLGDLTTIISQLGFFVVTVTIGLIISQLTFNPLLYLLILRKNPYKFYLGMSQAILTAFSTGFSIGTVPVTFKCVTDLGVDERIAQLILPIGASINKDGTAFYISAASIFIAQLSGIALSFGDLVTISMTSLAVSIAGGSSIVAIMLLMNGFGVPSSDVALLFIVDWLLDRSRTVNNVLGDSYSAAIIQHFSKDELKRMSDEDNKLSHEPRIDNIQMAKPNYNLGLDLYILQ